MLLAIDTATAFAGLALFSPDGVWAEDSWYAARNHSVTLMPRLHQMLATIKVKVSDLDAIVVSLGPGSYTGVRVAAAIAKGLALPHQTPVVGIPTLDVTAYPFRHNLDPVIAVAEAGRKRVLAARYAHTEPGWQQTVPPATFTIEELAASFSDRVLITGELRAEDLAYFQAMSVKNIQVAPAFERVRRPSVLAHLGWLKLSTMDISKLDPLEPIYLNAP